MRLVIKEVLVLNSVAFMVGIILAVAFTFYITKSSFEDIGGTMVFIRGTAFILALLTPLFTSIFTLIPIFRNLTNVDGIKIIEQ